MRKPLHKYQNWKHFVAPVDTTKGTGFLHWPLGNAIKDPPECEIKVDSSWNVMAHGDAREEKWRGNWRMEWVDSTLHTTSEHGVSSITTADVHTSAASSRLNWRPRRFKWTRPLRRKTKSGSCACAITFQTRSTKNWLTLSIHQAMQSLRASQNYKSPQFVGSLPAETSSNAHERSPQYAKSLRHESDIWGSHIEPAEDGRTDGTWWRWATDFRSDPNCATLKIQTKRPFGPMELVAERHQNSAGMWPCVAGLVGWPSTTFRKNSVSPSSEVQSKTLNQWQMDKASHPTRPDSSNARFWQAHISENTYYSVYKTVNRESAKTDAQFLLHSTVALLVGQTDNRLLGAIDPCFWKTQLKLFKV
jgi:hypothetical protein